MGLSKKMKTQAAYGLWKSKITPELIAASIRVGDPMWDTDGKTLLWREGRSGKGVLMAQPNGEAPYELSGEINVKGGVGYGGGGYTVQHGLAIFAGKDGRLYRRTLGAGFPKAIKPAFGGIASPTLSPDNRWVAFVHTYEGRDVIALVDSEGVDWPIKLVEGADFYMQPAWRTSGEGFTWVEWDHPNMPWDGTRLMYGVLKGDPPKVEAAKQFAGDEDTAILQPAFSPDGRYLSYLQNEGEFDQLVLMDFETGEKTLLVEGKVMLKPAWIQGIVVQGWSPDSRRITFTKTSNGVNQLCEVAIQTGEIQEIDMASYTYLSQPSISWNGQLALQANSPYISTRIISRQDGKITIHQRSTNESIHHADLPEPYEINWQSSDGETDFQHSVQNSLGRGGNS